MLDKQELLAWAERTERARVLRQPPAPLALAERPTVHWTELHEDTSGGSLAREWNFYRQQVGRLLAEGHEKRWVLIKGEEIIGIWDTEEEADAVRVERFLMQAVLIHQVLTREPLIRGPLFFRLCRD